MVSKKGYRNSGVTQVDQAFKMGVGPRPQPFIILNNKNLFTLSGGQVNKKELLNVTYIQGSRASAQSLLGGHFRCAVAELNYFSTGTHVLHAENVATCDRVQKL